MIQDCAGDPREENDNDNAPPALRSYDSAAVAARLKASLWDSIQMGPGVECDTSEGIAVFRLTPETEQLVAEATSLRNELTEVAAALGLDAADWRDLARGVRELAAEHRALTYERLVELGQSIRPTPAEPEFDVGPGVRVTFDGLRWVVRLTPEAERLLRDGGARWSELADVVAPRGGNVDDGRVRFTVQMDDVPPVIDGATGKTRTATPEEATRLLAIPGFPRPLTTVTLEAATINAAEPTGYRSPADAHLTPPEVSDGR